MEINLTDDEFYTIALFLKRLSWTDYESNAVDEKEAHKMKAALYLLERNINENGFNPR